MRMICKDIQSIQRKIFVTEFIKRNKSSLMFRIFGCMRGNMNLHEHPQSNYKEPKSLFRLQFISLLNYLPFFFFCQTLVSKQSQNDFTIIKIIHFSENNSCNIFHEFLSYGCLIYSTNMLSMFKLQVQKLCFTNLYEDFIGKSVICQYFCSSLYAAV